MMLNISLCSLSAVWPNLSSGSVPTTDLPCSRKAEGGGCEIKKKKRKSPCACSEGCFSHSLSLKVSWATGVSLSLDWRPTSRERVWERRTITASFAVIQPSTHLQWTARKESTDRALPAFYAGQRYRSEKKRKEEASLFFIWDYFFTDFLFQGLCKSLFSFPPWC